MMNPELAEVLDGSRKWTVVHGDCLDVLRSMPDCCLDSMVTDPPAGIAFMNRAWDKDKGGRDKWITWLAEIMREALRVMKPGAHGLVWALPKTSHWTATALEDAGFEVRDVVTHHFGSGFPKSLDVARAVDASDAAQEQEARRLRFTEWVRSTGVTATQIDIATSSRMGGHYTTAASQPAIMTREHLEMCRSLFAEVPEWVEGECDRRTVESRNLASREILGRSSRPPGWFTSGNGYDISAPATPEAAQWNGWGTALKPGSEHWILVRKPLEGTVADNVLKHGTGALNIDSCRVATDWNEPDRPDSWKRSGHTADPGADKIAAPPGNGIECHPGGRWPTNVVFTHSWNCNGECATDCPVAKLTEQSGETARFFHQFHHDPPERFLYAAKPSRAERDSGLARFKPRSGAEATNSEDGQARLNSPRTGAGRTGGARNIHPTAKGDELMRWLCRLVTPPGGVIGDWFAGSGTTGRAARLEGFRFIGAEMMDTDDEPFVSIARARIAWVEGQEITPRESLRSEKPPKQVSLFEMEST
jgi:hypothetical protein